MGQKLFLSICASIFLLSCSHVKNEIPVRKPDYVPPADNSNSDSVASKIPTLDFETLSQIIIKSNSQTVAEAIEQIAKNHSPYMKLHTLMYNSLSLQGSSFLEPRVIIFGPTAQFIFTFNGSTDQRGGATIETVEFDSVRGQFSFREILFKNENTEQHDILKESEINFQNDNVRISKANPGKCLLCHSLNASPIWETYFLWPGAYGSNDDVLTQSLLPNEDYHNGGEFSNGNNNFFNNQTFQSQGRTIAMKYQDTEAIEFGKYLKAKHNHPRYKHLPYRTVDELALKNLGGVSVQTLNAKSILLEEAKSLGINPELLLRPNSFLMDGLYEMSLSRLVQDIQKYNLADKIQNAGITREILESNTEKLPASFLENAEQKIGPFQTFKQNLAKREMDMQCAKIAEFRKSLGELKSDGVKHYSNDREIKIPRPALCQLQDYNLALLTENDVDEIAKLAYVLEYFNFPITKYTINFYRVSTLNGSSLDPVMKALFY